VVAGKHCNQPGCKDCKNTAATVKAGISLEKFCCMQWQLVDAVAAMLEGIVVVTIC
jgi:hypothetical protein